MTKIEYISGILDRLIAGTINGKPYIMLEDAKYIIENLDSLNNENNKK